MQDVARLTVLQRLHDRSRQDGECLIWAGPPGKDGYGQIRVDGKVMKVHRAAWIERHGPIPHDKVVLHCCDNKLCWQDAHLRLGTQADNLADMTTKGRRRSGAHWAAKRAARLS